MSDLGTVRGKTISGAFWKFGERVLAEGIHFVISIILARILMPDDYGLIALVSIFTVFCDKLIICGFATSLIQKKNADNVDFSSVFYFSLAAAIVLYALLFFMAPFIASFYEKFDRNTLIAVIRVSGVSLFLVAFNSVQLAYISKNMLFKRNFWSVLGAIIVSGGVGITMAYDEYGVWALVAQNIIKTFVGMLILLLTVRWKPDLSFSIARLKELFSYGWKIFVSSIIKVIYNDLRSLVIGKVYTPADLAFYNRGQTLPQMIDTNVTGTIDSVLFPAYSKLQDDKTALVGAMRRAVKTSSYIMMPALALMAAVASPLVSVLLTNKWLPCVPFMQILCLAFMFSPVETENLQSIKAIGRSDIVLKLEIAKRTIGVLLLIVAVPIGLQAIAWSMVVGNVIAAILNAYPNRELIGYSFFKQFMDIVPSLLMSTFIFIVANAFVYFNPAMNVWWQLIGGAGLGILAYFICSWIFRVEAFSYIISSLHKKEC